MKEPRSLWWMHIAMVGAGMMVTMILMSVLKETTDWIDYSAVGILIAGSTIRSALLYIKDKDDYLHK